MCTSLNQPPTSTGLNSKLRLCCSGDSSFERGAKGTPADDTVVTAGAPHLAPA